MIPRQPQLLSVVVPCYNEEEVIGETHKRLIEALTPLAPDFEIIYVNDGSRDGTLGILSSLRAVDSRARVIDLSRNFGHQIAVTAGVDAARGGPVVLIDADLQDPPEVIAGMMEKWREGYDVVYGVRASREGESAFKLKTARAFYRTLNKMSEVPMPLDTGDFRLMDRRVVDILKAMPERHRFLRGMVAWIGFKQCALPYDRKKRFAGVSKYPLRKMIAFATTGILSFSSQPLRWATMMGVWTSVLSLLGILYVVGLRLFTANWVSGWTLLMVAVLFLGGVQLLCLGIIGEYVGRVHEQTKGRPLYLATELDPAGAVA